MARSKRVIASSVSLSSCILGRRMTPNLLLCVYTVLLLTGLAIPRHNVQSQYIPDILKILYRNAQAVRLCCEAESPYGASTVNSRQNPNDS
jgi:hypothetical protein